MRSDRMLSVSSVADALNCSKRHIYNLIKAKQFSGVFKVGPKKGYRVPLSSVMEYKNRQIEALQTAIEYGEV